MWITLEPTPDGPKIMANTNAVTPEHPKLPMQITKDTWEEFCDIWEEIGRLGFSSQLNWPEEVTDDHETLVMCDLITGNNITGIQDKIGAQQDDD